MTVAEAALWVGATLEDDFAPVYLGKGKIVEAVGETRWYSWGWGASRPAVDAAAEEALQVPVMENRNAGHKMSITVQSHFMRTRNCAI